MKQETCAGCKAPLRNKGEKTLCRQCRPKAGDLYYRQLATVTDLENKFSRAWTQCQRCTGYVLEQSLMLVINYDFSTLHQTVLCTSRDCPIFYMRTKVQKDLRDAQNLLEKFDIDW